MKSKLVLAGLMGLSVLSTSVFAAEYTTINFDNRTAHPSTIRLHIGTSGGAIACSDSAMMQRQTGNSGVTEPHSVNSAKMETKVLLALCRGTTCKADLYMGRGCAGPIYTTVLLPLGAQSTVDPVVSGPYRFTGTVNGIIMECADGSTNC